jgi:CubicO group peptidase (beta-lactamase class C family)
MKKRIIIWLFIISAGIFSCRTGEDQVSQYYTYQIPTNRNDGWETAHLSSHSIDVQQIEMMVVKIKENIFKNIHGILLVRNGKLVLEEYFPGEGFYEGTINYNWDVLHWQASCTKSFTSALVGIAYDRGHITSLETRIQDFFPEFANISWINGKQNITLKHLLTMTAGLDWDEWAYSYFDPRNIHYQMSQSWYPLLFIITVPMAYQPGEMWVYNSGLSILLGGIIKNTTSLYADEFAELYLFEPLGITEYEWQILNYHTIQTGGGLILKPRDMAKFGQLYLNNGVWKGKRIISEYWVGESVKKHVARSTGWYGFQWWLEQHPWNGELVDSFYARGLGGEYIFIFTELDLVVAITAGNQYTGAEPELTLINQYILPAVQAQ